MQNERPHFHFFARVVQKLQNLHDVAFRKFMLITECAKEIFQGQKALHIVGTKFFIRSANEMSF